MFCPCFSERSDQLECAFVSFEALSRGQRLQVVEEIDVDVVVLRLWHWCRRTHLHHIIPPSAWPGAGKFGIVSRMRPLLLTLCLCLAGCESVGDVVNKRRSGVQKRLAAIQALKLPAEPVAEVKVKPAPLVLERSSGGPESNAMFVYAEDLAKPGEARAVHLRTLDSAPLLQCGSLLSKQTYFGDSITRPMPSVVDGYLGACERLQYVLVIRLVEFKPPELSLETKKFVSGLYRAEVLAFDLKSGALLGGFPVVAKNEDSVMLLDGDADHTKRLISNLESTVFSALREGARKAFPGSLP